MMELPPRAYEERVREETDWCALTFASAVAAEYERGHRESSLSKSSLTKLETLVAKHAAVTGAFASVSLSAVSRFVSFSRFFFLPKYLGLTFPLSLHSLGTISRSVVKTAH